LHLRPPNQNFWGGRVPPVPPIIAAPGHNVTNANANPNPNLNPSPNPNSTPNPKFNPILNLNPNPYCCVSE